MDHARTLLPFATRCGADKQRGRLGCSVQSRPTLKELINLEADTIALSNVRVGSRASPLQRRSKAHITNHLDRLLPHSQEASLADAPDRQLGAGMNRRLVDCYAYSIADGMGVAARPACFEIDLERKAEQPVPEMYARHHPCVLATAE